jgi:hypothetical protein
METDDPRYDPDIDDREGSRPRAVSDLFRKAIVSSVGALFMTEEGIRSMVKELKLPKEVIGAVLAQADRTKGEVVRVVGTEVRSFLESTRMREDLLDLLTQLRFEVKAEVGIKRRDEESRIFEPSVKARVDVKKEENAAKGKGAGKEPSSTTRTPRKKKTTS